MNHWGENSMLSVKTGKPAVVAKPATAWGTLTCLQSLLKD